MSSARPPLHFILGDGVIGQAVADELARLGQPLTLASRSGPKALHHTPIHGPMRWTPPPCARPRAAAAIST